MLSPRLCRATQTLLFFFFTLSALGATVTGATLPTGFTEALVANGLSNPTAMEFAPDGRLFVSEQQGRLRIIENGVLLSQPFLTLTVDSDGERGLIGVAFDPAFATNKFVYVYYTATTPTIHNRVSRFTASGNVAVPGSETIVFDLDNLSSATNHNGGAIHFGPDGKLYVATGENGNSANAQSLNTVLGKVLRLNKDGTIPTDNPFFTSTTGKNRAIWALGLRNPFTFAFRPFAGDLYINDVGETSWEEINDGLAGANYGWPDTEGSTTNPNFKTPRVAYGHSGGACAVTGGAFYAPLTGQFPSDYTNDYFFADYCAGWIRRLDAGAGGVTTFATGLAAPVDIKVADDGSLYYLARGSGSVFRVQYGAARPSGWRGAS
jgi:glucose/arabinose dehydrogenase